MRSPRRRWLLVRLASSLALVWGGTGCATPAPPDGSATTSADGSTWSARPAGRTASDQPRSALAVNGSPRAERTDTLEIVNPEPRAVRLSLTTRSVSTPNGQLHYSTPTEVTDPARWMRLPSGAQDLMVPPRTVAPVQIRFRFPTTARPGEALAAVQIVDLEMNRAEHVLARIRVNGPLRSELSVTNSTVRLSRSRLGPFAPGQAEADLRIRNTGNTVLTGHLVTQLDTVFDRKVRIGRTPDEIVLIPGASLRSYGAAEAWPAFVVRPEVVLEVERDPERVPDRAAADREPSTSVVTSAVGPSLTVVPWAQLGLLAVTALGVHAAWFGLRATARRRSAARQDRP